MKIDYADFASIGKSIGEVVSDKQRQYGDSFSKAPKILAILYPEGISLDQLESALTVVRVIDKLNRIATNKADLGGEDPWSDIVGYGILEVMRGRPFEFKNPVREAAIVVQNGGSDDIPF